MNLYDLNNYLSGIESINTTLISKKDSLSHARVEKIMCNLDQLLHDLEHHVSTEHFTTLTESLKPGIVEILQTVHQTLDLYSERRLEKIDSIKHRLLDLQSSVATQPMANDKEVYREDIVTLAYFCDLDLHDHNGAIAWFMKQALMQNIPLITTRSILLGKERVAEEGKIMDCFLEMHKLLFENRDKWDIYQNGEAFVFIPKSVFPDLYGLEKLEAFDFRTDGKLQQSSVEAVFEKAATKSTIHDVIDLFCTEAKVDTIFNANGHGGANSVAGLNEENYRIFLDFLYNRRCKGLAISSCAAGGKSSLMNIPEHASTTHAGFLDQEKAHPFPVLVRSLGDFKTYTEQPAESDLRSFLDEFSSFVLGPQTMKKLCKTLERVEKGRNKTFRNLVKFYPAHGAGIPGGFRPAAENKNGFALTYNMVKKAEIGGVISKDPEKMSMPPKIIVKGSWLLEIHPLVTPLSIQFEGANQTLLSMDPGSGHHFIKAIELKPYAFILVEPLYLIKNTIDLHKNDLLHANKGFFLGEIKCHEKAITGVALKITPSGALCVGKDGEGNCFLTKDGASVTKITPFMYGLICKEIMSSTQAEEKTLISMSGGQESEEQFKEAIHSSGHFSVDFDQVFNLENELIFENIKSQLQPNDLEASVMYLLEKGDVERAFQLFKNEKLDMNMKKFDGTPLLFIAIQARAVDMVHYLLSHGADINIPNAAGRPLLNHAVIQLGGLYKKRESGADNAKAVAEGEEILELLLDHPALNLEALNSLGWTALANGLSYPEVLKKLVERGAKIDFCNRSGCSLLSALISTHEVREREALLRYDPDPNLGSPTPLANAFRVNDAQLIEKLLEGGGTPFKQDVKGKVPFIEAILWTSAETVEKLLDRMDCDPEVVSKNGMFPLLAALITGNKEKMEMLNRKKFTFPDSLSKEAESYFKIILERYLQSEDAEGIKLLLEMDNVPRGLVAEHLLKKLKQPFLKKLLDDGVIAQSILPVEAVANLLICESVPPPVPVHRDIILIKNESRKMLMRSS